MKYFRASGLSEAASAIEAGAQPLAGGTVVVPNISLNGARENVIVDISRISELAQVSETADNLRLGSLVSLAAIAKAKTHAGLEALNQAASSVGNPHVRRAATIGGNVALGISTADMIPALVALDAEVICYAIDGEQSVPISSFNASGRLITAIQIPLRASMRSHFQKFAWRNASGITIVSVAVGIVVNDGLISMSRVVVGGLRKTPQRLTNAEAILENHKFSPEQGESVAAAAAAEAVCDLAGPPGERYRRSVLGFGVRDALEQLANR
jgi:CO/xanthine dehydrogenase FAD-binding subunit